jgi:hypothetical protein
MIDFIQIDQDTFLKYKNVAEDNIISEKIKTLLDKFGCFHDYTAFHSYNSKAKKHPSHHNSHNNHHNHPAIPRTKLVNKNHSSLEREITGLLNKISKQNYTTIARQILKIINQENTEEIVLFILKKCYKQPGFLELYIGLLSEIYLKSESSCRSFIYTMLSDYITDFISGDAIKTFHLDSVNYDEFCINMLNKNDIIGKHKTIIALILNILRNNLIDEYFNIMFNEIIQMDKIYEKDGFERHELLLDIMTDFIKADIKYKIYIEKYYKTHVNILDTYTLKAKFKVLDMVTIIL